MHFLDQRIQVICDQLKKQAVIQSIRLPGWEIKEGNYLHPSDADAAPAPYAPFDSLTMHWYGPDKHYWFRVNVTVPDSFDGQPLWMHVATQIDEWDDGKNPQFLLFVDGDPVQGVDMNHRDILITSCAKAGQTYRLDLQSYTGTLHSEFNLIVYLQQIDPEIMGLYWDLQVPLDGFSRMDEQSQSRMALEKVMNDAINLLDLRTPYRQDYLNGGPCMPSNMPVVPHSDAYFESVRAARAYLQKHLYEELGGYDDVIATCIGHTHIDVAWWWTVEQTREKVARSFATVLKLMDEYPSYKFMSSQPQLYAFLKERYPELYARIKERVAEGRWEPEGGMWVEADCNVTSGESLVRQFIHGKNFFRQEFDKDNKILWLPDVFGYSAALPQIMKECGIEYFMTTKIAWNQFNKLPCDTFMWRGIDGTEILTHLITTQDPNQSEQSFFTTYNGKLHSAALMAGWKRYQNKNINNDILISFGYGDGGGGPTRAMLETGDRLAKGVTGIPKVRQEGSLTYFRELDQRVRDNRRLPTWEGELYLEYHRGTYTSMARNKRSNRKAELHMMDLELLGVLAADKVAYPAKDTDAMWKTILINQFHDILPGSSIHEVYEVTKQEYAELEEKIARLEAERTAALVQPTQNVTLFNTKGFTSDEVVALGDVKASALRAPDGSVYPVQQTADGAIAFVRALPSKGYMTFVPAEGETAALPFHQEGSVLETPFYTVEIAPDGTFSRLFDKENRREVFKAGQCGNLLRMYEDKPIYYDNWDIDEFYTEKYWDMKDVQSMTWTEMGPVRATLEIVRKESLSTICQKIHFYADDRRIDFETVVDWKEHQHLLKVLFPVDIHADEATFDVQFGNLKRKVHKNTSWEQARFESCAQKWMDFSEGHYGVSLLNDCKYGHSVNDGVMGLTLIKSGIEPNPVADQEVHVFTYALYPHAEGWQQAGTVRAAQKLNQPALAVAGGEDGQCFSLCSVTAPNVMLETVKQAEDGDGWIVRMYETENARTECSFRWERPCTSIEECNCMEDEKTGVKTSAQQIDFVIKPFEIKTFRIR